MDAQSEVRVAPDVMIRLVRTIFESVGCSATEAAGIAKRLTGANLRGHDSQGVIRVPRYLAWIETGHQKIGEDVIRLARDRSEHCPETPGYRWGATKAQVGFHGGESEVERPVQIRSSQQSAPPDLWHRHSHSALPNSQGAHHH